MSKPRLGSTTQLLLLQNLSPSAKITFLELDITVAPASPTTFPISEELYVSLILGTPTVRSARMQTLNSARLAMMDSLKTPHSPARPKILPTA